MILKYLYSDENLFYNIAEMHFHLQLLQRGQSAFQHFILSDHVCVLAEFFQLFCSVSLVPKFSHGRTPEIILHILRSPHTRKHSQARRSCWQWLQFSYVKLLSFVSTSIPGHKLVWYFEGYLKLFVAFKKSCLLIPWFPVEPLTVF
jgi:hypothetical protein